MTLYYSTTLFPDKQYFVIADVKVYDADTFINEYSPKTAKMKEGGKVSRNNLPLGVVAPC